MNNTELGNYKNTIQARHEELKALYSDLIDVFLKHDNYMISYDYLFEEAMNKYNYDEEFKKELDEVTTYKSPLGSRKWMRTAIFMLAYKLMHGRM